MVKLTQYSHGAGCGCKIAPNVLDKILSKAITVPDNQRLLVGNHSKDDAAAYDLGNGQVLVSTTDFFMPIVDNPYEFGRIASANAISDVYAMGGRPIMAIAILGWPINVLGPDIAAEVVSGSRSICIEAGIPLAGGHSIDAPEPIFGLAVNGLVDISDLKQNNTARAGDILFLTKPIGIGILTTAEKKNLLKPEHVGLAAQQMMHLNAIGMELAKIKGVHAMTDVTGFGLLGHLSEVAEGSQLTAEIQFNSIPLITNDLLDYIQLKSVPGGTHRNMKAYGHKIEINTDLDLEVTTSLLADPQTSGGLLVAVAPESVEQVQALLVHAGYSTEPIGMMHPQMSHAVRVV